MARTLMLVAALALAVGTGCASWRTRRSAPTADTPSSGGGDSRGILRDLADTSAHNWNFKRDGW
jgi:hypothetical protein